jgi:hypothetical protein
MRWLVDENIAPMVARQIQSKSRQQTSKASLAGRAMPMWARPIRFFWRWRVRTNAFDWVEA